MLHTVSFVVAGLLLAVVAVASFHPGRDRSIQTLVLGAVVACGAGWLSIWIFSFATANVASLVIAAVAAAVASWALASRGRNRRHERTPATANQSLIGHIPALDGVRGIAILLVLTEHSWIPTWNEPVIPGADKAVSFIYLGGWSGVDLFFVLSGYLITSILWQSRGRESYFRNFYVRRVLRIFPLYYGVLILYFLVGPHLPNPPALGDAAREQAWYWLYLSNISMARHGNFAPSSLGVSWSLAIEEQFYWLWPPLVLVLSRRRLLRLCVGLVAAAFLWRLLLVVAHVNPQSIYVLLPTQMDALAAGALVSLVVQDPTELLMARKLAPWIGAGALAVFVVLGVHAAGTTYAYFEGDPYVQTVGYSALVALFASVVLITASRTQGQLASAVLESRFLRTMGKYSYGMYLLHRPVLAFLAIAILPGLVASSQHTFGAVAPAQIIYTTTFVACASCVAWVSWNYYETVFLRLKRIVGYRDARRNDAMRPNRELVNPPPTAAGPVSAAEKKGEVPATPVSQDISGVAGTIERP